MCFEKLGMTKSVGLLIFSEQALTNRRIRIFLLYVANTPGGGRACLLREARKFYYWSDDRIHYLNSHDFRKNLLSLTRRVTNAAKINDIILTLSPKLWTLELCDYHIRV